MKLSHLLSYIAICLIVLSGCDGQDEAARVAAAKPEVSVSADEMIKDFWSDQGAANRKYKDKIIVVEGFVESIESDGEMASFSLDGDPAKATEIGSPNISCDFEKPSDMPPVEIGDPVRIKGLREGRLSNMIMMGSCVKAD